MALTEEEKKKLMRMIDGLDQTTTKRVLKSEESFLAWLKQSASTIYDKIKGYAQSLWEFFSNLF